MVIVPRLRPQLWLLPMFAAGTAWSVVLSVILWGEYSLLQWLLWYAFGPVTSPGVLLTGRMIDAGLIAPLIAKFIYRHPSWKARIALAYVFAAGSMVGPTLRTWNEAGIAAVIFGAPPMCIAVLAFVGLYHFIWKAPRWHDGTTCARCRYSLFGLPQPVCPECGTAASPDDLRPRPIKQELRTVGVLSVLLLLCAYGMHMSMYRLAIHAAVAFPQSPFFVHEMEAGYFLDFDPPATNRVIASYLKSADAQTRVLAADGGLYRPHLRLDGKPYERRSSGGTLRDERWPEATIEYEVIDQLRLAAQNDADEWVRACAALAVLRFDPTNARTELPVVWDKATVISRPSIIWWIRAILNVEPRAWLGDRLDEDKLDPQSLDALHRPLD